MTGGPGCSGSIALFHENGPCKINSDGATTRLNPYSWNNNASVIYIDQPAGVGFSYGAAGDEDHNETMVAEDMYHFMHEFFDANPQFQQNEFFIFGESYGGHYAPAVANRIGNSLNLKGLAVGNGLTVPEIQYKYYSEMAYTYAIQRLGHPTITKTQYDQMNAAWPTCQSMIKQCQSDTTSCGNAQSYCNNAMLLPYEMTGLNVYDIRSPCKIKPLCYNFSDVSTFLDLPSVRAALGVTETTPWQSCNFTVNAAFSNDWMKDFDAPVANLLSMGVRVMIYAGDVDFICNWLGNKAWTLALQWSGGAGFNSEKDVPWYVGTSTDPAGVVRSSGGLTFLQVHNAGHMVPLDAPVAALQLFNTFTTTGWKPQK